MATAKSSIKTLVRSILAWLITIAVLTSFVIVCVWATPFVIDKWAPDSVEQSDPRGPWGDQFGLTNSVFSGLALGAVAITLFLQTRELKLQSEDNKENQRILADQKRQLELQQEQMALQSRLMEIQSQDSMLAEAINGMRSTLADPDHKKTIQRVYGATTNACKEVCDHLRNGSKPSTKHSHTDRSFNQTMGSLAAYDIDPDSLKSNRILNNHSLAQYLICTSVFRKLSNDDHRALQKIFEPISFISRLLYDHATSRAGSGNENIDNHRTELLRSHLSDAEIFLFSLYCEHQDGQRSSNIAMYPKKIGLFISYFPRFVFDKYICSDAYSAKIDWPEEELDKDS